jgi:hypothetical protein
VDKLQANDRTLAVIIALRHGVLQILTVLMRPSKTAGSELKILVY